jgi:hypothetical protein
MDADHSEVGEQFIRDGDVQENFDASAQIKDRQSVRTTVKLSLDAFDALSWLSDYWNVPQKEIIDLALQEAEKLLESHGTAEVVEIAKAQSNSERKRKTLVMSQSSRKRLNRLADSHDVSRDNWLALAISFANAMTKKRIEKHKKVLGRIQAYLDKGEELEEEIRSEVGSDDPVFEGFGLVVTSLMNLVDEIETEIEGGDPIHTSHL